MTDSPSPTFGQLLRRHRRAAGLTQEALAERAGISHRTVSDLERGLYQRPHRDTVHLLAEALGLPDEERRALVSLGGRGPSPVSVPDAGPGGAQSPIGAATCPACGAGVSPRQKVCGECATAFQGDGMTAKGPPLRRHRLDSRGGRVTRRRVAGLRVAAPPVDRPLHRWSAVSRPRTL